LLLFDPGDRWRFLHKGWATFFLVATAVAIGLRWWVGRDAAESLTGGSRIGLLYGIGAAALIVFTVLLAGLRWVPKWWWIGSRKSWLKAHIWLGLLSGVLVYCHTGGLHWGGFLEKILSLVFALTILTGIFGLVVQQILPGRMVVRLGCEVPYEQIPHVCKRMCEEADLLIKEALSNSKLPAQSVKQLHSFYETVVRLCLVDGRSKAFSYAEPGSVDHVFGKVLTLPGVAAVNGVLAKLQTMCTERLLLAEQERLQGWLHGWLYLHVPFSAALVVLVTVHAVMALRY